MKLTIEKHPEFIRLLYIFKKIEILADKMGIDVDDLVHDHQFRDFVMYPSFQNTNKAFTHRRVEMLLNHRENILMKSPVVGLKILLNNSEEE